MFFCIGKHWIYIYIYIGCLEIYRNYYTTILALSLRFLRGAEAEQKGKDRQRSPRCNQLFDGVY